MSVLASAEAEVAFTNPNAFGYDASLERASDLAITAGIATLETVEEIPHPKHIQTYVEGKTIAYSGGGDGTINHVVGAIIGHYRDDPEATALHAAEHTELASEIIYVAGADGTANNFPYSALGRYADKPASLIDNPAAWIGQHHPLIAEIVDENGEIVRTRVVTSCLGAGGAANAAADLEVAKPELKRYNHTRLPREAIIALEGVVRTRAFSVVETRTVTRGHFLDRTRQVRDDISGYELVGSRIYAKAGRTHNNIDDDFQQPVVLRHKEMRNHQRAAAIGVMLGIKMGLFWQRKFDFDPNTELSLQLTSEEPVPLHVDGDVDEAFQLEPGQTLFLRRSKIAVATAMAR